MPTGGQRGGRIRPHQRETNDDTDILGEDVEVSAAHTAVELVVGLIFQGLILTTTTAMAFCRCGYRNN